MPELVGSMSFGQSKVTSELLKVIGYKGEVESLSDSLKTKLSSTQSQCILLYRPLASTLQFAVDQAKDFEATVEGWAEEATFLLSLVKSYRQQVLLFNEKDVSLNPEAFVQYIHKKGVISTLPDTYPELTANPPSSFSQFIASDLQRRDAVLNRLENQLLALSQPIISEVELQRVDPLQVMKAYRQLKSRRDQLNRESKNLKNSNAEVSNRLQAAEADFNGLKEQLAIEIDNSKKVKAELNSLNEQFLTLQKTLVDAENNITQKSEQIADLKNSDDTQRKQIVSLESSVETFEKKTSSLKAEIAERDELIRALEVDKAELGQRFDSTLEVKDKELADLSESLKSAQSELKLKQDSIKALESNKAELSQRLSSTIAAKDKELAGLSESLKSAQSELKLKQDSIKALESNKAELSQRLTSSIAAKDKELADLSESLKSVQSELKLKKDSIKALESNKAELSQRLSSTIAAKDKELADLSESLKSVQSELKLKQDSIQTLESNKAELSQRLTSTVESKDKEIAILTETLNQAQANLKKSGETVKSLEATKSAISQQLHELEKAAAAKQTQLESERDEVTKALSRVTTESLEKQTQLDELNGELVALHKDCADAKEEVTLLLEQLHGVQEALESKTIECSQLEVDKEQKHKEWMAALAEKSQAYEQLNAEKEVIEGRLADALLQNEQSQSDLNVSVHALEDIRAEFNRSSEALVTANADLNNLKTENELLLEQLHSVQEALEQQSFESKALEQERQQLTEAIGALEQQLTEITQSWSISDQASARLAADVLNLQKEKAEWITKKQALLEDSRQFNRMKAEYEELQAHGQVLSSESRELEQEKNTLLERIAMMDQAALENRQRMHRLEQAVSDEQKKLRALQEKSISQASQAATAFTGISSETSAADNQLREENALLLEQLHLVQEELEHYFVKYRDVEQNESRLLASVPSLLSALRKFPYAHVSKTQHTLILRHVFDEKWYLSAYPDVAKSPAAAKAPFMHFLHHGFFEGRNPRADLDTLAFVQDNPEVLSGHQHPVLSWAEHLNHP